MNMASGNSTQRNGRPRKRLLGGLFALLPVALLGACLLARQLVAAAFPGTAAAVVGEGLLIIGWVLAAAPVGVLAAYLLVPILHAWVDPLRAEPSVAGLVVDTLWTTKDAGPGAASERSAAAKVAR